MRNNAENIRNMTKEVYVPFLCKVTEYVDFMKAEESNLRNIFKP